MHISAPTGFGKVQNTCTADKTPWMRINDEQAYTN